MANWNHVLRTLGWPVTWLLVTVLVILGVVLVAGVGLRRVLVVEHGASSLPPSNFVVGEFLLKFKPGVATEEIRVAHATTKAAEIEEIAGTGVVRMRVPAGSSVGEMVRWYGKNPLVQYAEPNYLLAAGTAADVAKRIITEAKAGEAIMSIETAGDVPTNTVQSALSYAQTK